MPGTMIAARAPRYDLEGAVTIELLNRALDLAIRTGALPSSFTADFASHDDHLKLTLTTTITLRLIGPRLVAVAGAPHRLGLQSDFAGEIVNRIVLSDWQIAAPAGPHLEPGLDRTVTVDLHGSFTATADAVPRAVDGKELVALSFAGLQALDIDTIDDVPQGPTFREAVRRVLDRIGVVALRTQLLYPALSGLPGSLPAPLHGLTDTFSGQAGLVDFKVVQQPDGSGGEVHLLLQAKTDLGQQDYDAVGPLCVPGADLAASVDAQWIREIMQDLWAGGLWPPRRFATNGRPDPDGPVEIRRIDLTLFDDGTMQIGVDLNGKVLGVPLELAVLVRIRPRIDAAGLLFADVVSVDTELDWARAGALSLVFFVLRDIGGFLLLRAVDEALGHWTAALLEQYLAGKGIALARHFAWSGTPFTVDLGARWLRVTSDSLTLGANLAIHL